MEQNRYFGRVVPMGDPTVSASLVEPVPAAALRARGRPGSDEECEQVVMDPRVVEAWTNLGRS